MNRRSAIRQMATLILTTASCAEPQQAKKIWRIGYLSTFDPATESARAEGIRLALREHGHIEGQNIAIEYRYAENNRDRLPELAAELVRHKVDIIVAAGPNRTIQSLKNATKTIPIVMVGAGSDPVEAGFIESLAHPVGNITGLTIEFGGELVGKRLELFKEGVPKLARVAVLYDPVNPTSGLALKGVLPDAARALKLIIQPWEVRTADEFDRVFAALNKQRADGLQVLGGWSNVCQPKADCELRVKEPVTVDVRGHSSCRRWRAHVLRGGYRGELPARRLLHRQNSQRRQARGLAGGAADEV